jgi:ATP-dependent helicase/nuclease subunit A
VTVKRRSDEAADEVRVMTVHGAKGLQAPVVILPDTGCRQEAGRPPEVVPLGGATAWRVARDACPPALAEAEAARRTAMIAENRRLLYVALTRPESWLVVCGAGKPGRSEDDCWHAAVEDALKRLGVAPGDDGRLVLAQGWPAGAVAPKAAVAAVAVLPDWRLRPAPAAPEPPRPRSPSDLGGSHALPGEPAEEDPRARGGRLHLLLEGLAGVPAAARAARAAHLLPDAPDLAELLDEAASVLDYPEIAPLFRPGVRAEVGIAAPTPAGPILGRIDRLLIEADRVLAVDFKSNRVIPAAPDATPVAILRQMGAYAAGLEALYPSRRVETAIVWTRGPRLMPLPARLTRAALAGAS